MLFSNAVKQFIEERIAMRYSPHTIRDYGVTYKKFLACVGDVDIRTINKQNIVQFMASQSKISAKTLRNYHADLSALWQWAIQQGICDENPVRQIKAPVAEKKTILPFSKIEIFTILEAANHSSNPFQNRAIILLLLDTGIRASELCNLTINDLNKATNHILVFGKGKKERNIPISKNTSNAIEECLWYRKYTTANSPLFAKTNGKPLDRVLLGRILTRLGRDAGVSHVFPHRFRHTFAIQFLRNGGNIYSLQKILGHSTLDMVKRYLAIAQHDLDRDHEIASPVNHWGLR
ncbi:MAG: integrase [Bellilinea sp.]|nr:MAG: integrase [Bellilinea sp.]